MVNKVYVYVDSCCFIDLVKIGRGVPMATDDSEEERRKEDCWFLSRLCDASRDGALRIVTSMLTVVECTHLGDSQPPDQQTRNRIDAFLTSGVVVDLVSPDLFVIEKARSLKWDNAINLKPADAIHFATSLLHGCVEFITTDRAIHKKNAKFNKALPEIKKIGVRVIRGSQTTALPNEYRAEDLFNNSKGKE